MTKIFESQFVLKFNNFPVDLIFSPRKWGSTWISQALLSKSNEYKDKLSVNAVILVSRLRRGMTGISSKLNAYSANTLMQLLIPGSKSLLPPSSSKTKTNPLLQEPSQNAVVNKIEKHINDVKHGNGDASKDVAYILGQQDSNASTILSQTNPRALAMYSGYLSGLRYDRAARFVNGVEYGLSTLSKIGSAPNNEE